jgi:hypothetical protein
MIICILTGQTHYLDNYDGIPVIGWPNRNCAEIATTDAINSMVDLGIYGIYALDLNSTLYNQFKNNIKLFPDQKGWYNGVDDTSAAVFRYTGSIYSIWEAEGSGNGELGDTKIDYNNNIGEISTDGKAVEKKFHQLKVLLFMDHSIISMFCIGSIRQQLIIKLIIYLR